MADPFATPTEADSKNELYNLAWRKEQQRRSLDTLRVANPTTITIFGKPFDYPHGDYFVRWEQGRHRIPVNGTLDCVRYIAETFAREMFVEIINYYTEVEGEKLLKKTIKEQPNVALDKYAEQKTVWEKLPRTDNAELMKEIYPQLILGVVKKFGMDVPIDMEDKYKPDFRGNEEKVLESLDREILEVIPEVTKEELVEEVTTQ